MCEYCENGKEIEGEEYNQNTYNIDKNILNMNIIADVYDDFGNNVIDYVEVDDFIEIKYCPMCGRKLDKE